MVNHTPFGRATERNHEQNGDHVTVRTEESWSGAPVLTAAEQLRDALHQSLNSRLASLKAAAEHAR
ncbi:hypothetical protein [Streptomyces sp. NPDC058279]|uniref:hypothetical protein n=1 Tax=Streptomyces sp. NPDC058279 TaxID=3346418 RepID=UPI0036ECEF3F